MCYFSSCCGQVAAKKELEEKFDLAHSLRDTVLCGEESKGQGDRDLRWDYSSLHTLTDQEVLGPDLKNPRTHTQGLTSSKALPSESSTILQNSATI